MIDALVILFSAGMCLLVAFRALQLDAVLPWFGPERPPATQAEAKEQGSNTTAKGWRARAQSPR